MPKIGYLPVPEDAEFPAEGIAYWENPGNGFTILAVHDTADPEKRGREWTEETKRGYIDQRSYDQEHNLSFESWTGKPVFMNFDKAVHVANGHLNYSSKVAMQRWWDLGHHACVWAQVQDGQLVLFDSRQTIGAFGPQVTEYRPWELEVSGLGVFIERCLEISENIYPRAEVWRDIIDPSGKNNDVTHTRTATRIFQEHGLHPILGDTTDMVVRISDVDDWLMMRPGLLIDPQARVLIDGFAGGYKFMKEGISEKPDNQSGYGHCMTSVQYGASKNRAIHTKRKHQDDKIRNLDPARHDLRGPRRSHRGRLRKERNWMSY